MIDEHDTDNDIIPLSTAMDSFSIMNRDGQTLTQQNMNGELCVDESRVSDVLAGGKWFDNSTTINRHSTQRRLFEKIITIFDNIYFNNSSIQVLGLKNRPKPIGSTATNNH